MLLIFSFKFYSKFPFNSYIIVKYFRIQKKEEKKKKFRENIQVDIFIYFLILPYIIFLSILQFRKKEKNSQEV